MFVAGAPWRHSIDYRHLVTLHELIEHLLEGKGRIVLKDMLQQRVMDYLLGIIFAKNHCLLNDLLLNVQNQLKQLLKRRLFGQLVLHLRVD